MSATIKIKNSSTAGAAPTSSDLVQGELAVNVTDKRLYTENASGTVVELGTNPSVPVTFPDGSASAPSLTNDGDTNTGLFFPAADTIALTTGGSERLRLDSSGNLGLGVTPSSWSSSGNLQIKGSGLDGGIASANQYLVIGANGYYNAGWKYITTGNATLYQQSTGQHQWYNAASGTAGNTISFTQAMTLDASGNLGIGTTSPAKKLDIASGDIRLSSGYTVQWGGTNNYIYADSSSNFFTVITASSERMRIDSSGNLGVGTTSPSQRLDATVSSSTEGSGLAVTNSLTGGYGSGLTMYSVRSDNSAKMVAGRISMSGASSWNSDASTSSDMLFGTISANSFAERMRLTASGNLLVGATTQISAERLGVTFAAGNKGIALNVASGAAQTQILFANPNGTVGSITTTGAATAYVTSSDYRLKNTVEPMLGALAKVAELKPCTYKWNADGLESEGFIAHELAEVFPQAVVGEKDAVDADGNPIYQGIDTSFLVATLTAAIQEQQAIITQLQADVAALKG